MSLKYALLGFINTIPDLTGYDLKKYFDASVRFYWPATQSQIYRTLEELYSEGLVSQKIINQEDKPNKKIYSITKKGEKRLKDWLKKPAELPAIRHELLLKISYAAILPKEDIISLLQKYKQAVLERLQTYQNNNHDIIDAYASNEMEKFLWQFCLDNGLVYYQGELGLIEKAISSLQNRNDLTPGAAGR
jgi:DNA-binding PadR family transcriptional regulator